MTDADDDIALLVMRFAAAPAIVAMHLPADPLAIAEARRRVKRGCWRAACRVDERAGDGAVGKALDDALERVDHSTNLGLRLQVVHEGGDVRITIDGGEVGLT